MQFKRPRLVPARRLVNAGLAAGFLALAACGGEAPDETTEAGPESRTPAGENLILPAVWSTSALDGPVADIALSSGDAPLLAVAYENRGLELFNLEAERIAEIARFDIDALGAGTLAQLGDAQIAVFPGIDGEGRLNGYVFGPNMVAPAELALPVETDARLVGLCAHPAGPESGIVLEIGFWQFGADRTLVTGELTIEEGEFAWRETGRVSAEAPITACLAGAEGLHPVTGAILAAAHLERGGETRRLYLSDRGALMTGSTPSDARAVGLREGLSVRTPVEPVALDALGAPRDGGYPEGLIVIAGDTGGRHQVVFVDAGPLTNPDGTSAGR